MDLRARIGLLVEAQGARRAAQDIDGVARPVKRLGTETEMTGRKFKEAEVQALSFRRGLIGMTSFVSAGAAGIFGLGAILHGAADAYSEAYKTGRSTTAVIASTGGVANVTAKHVTDLSDAIGLQAGVDGDLIAQGENLLLTFRNIRNEAGLGNNIFDQTTQAAVDMSAAFKAAGKSMDVSTAALMLGKALNDPAKGMARLVRAGVTFSQQQIDQAKAMQKSGDVLGAQRLILAELNKEFGGEATATATPWSKANAVLRQLERTLGTALAPAIETALTDFADLIGQMERGTGAGGKLVHTAKDIWSVVKALSPVLIGLTAAFVTYKGVLLATAVAERAVAAVQLVQAFLAAAAATDVMTASMVALDVALDVNPIVLAVAAIVGLGAALVIAYRKVGWFRDGVQATYGWIKGHWPLLAGILTGGVVPAIVLIVHHWDAIKAAIVDFLTFVKTLPAKVGHALKNIWKGVPHPPWWLMGPLGGIHAATSAVGAVKGVLHGDNLGGVLKNYAHGLGIPGAATGANVVGSGSLLVGEDGPELLDVNPGARITPLSQPVATKAPTAGRGIVLHDTIEIDGRKVGTAVRRIALADLLATSPA